MSGPIEGSDPKAFVKGSGGMTPQVLQALECVICSEEYGTDFNHVPRILKCGHTHCTRCLHVMMRGGGVSCPICSTWHPVNQPDVTQLPPNFTIIEIVEGKVKDVQSTDSSQPLCGVCSTNTATIACIDCQPGIPFKFCKDCDHKEHNRNFGPVHRHRRFPVDRVPVATSYVCCSRHLTNKAVSFSEKYNEFACNTCESESDWQNRREHFEAIFSCAQRLRYNLQMLNQCTRDRIGKLVESKLRVEGIIHELGPSASTAKTQIATKFGEIVHQIQSRQQKLLNYVEEECTSRQHCLEQQLSEIQKANKDFNDAHEEVSSLLIPKNDFDFLTSYCPVKDKVEQLILNEDRSLQRPLAQHEIPLIFSKEVLERMGNLGAIGGGKTPTDLVVEPTRNKCDLLYLNWELPKDCGIISNFEVEFEEIFEDLASALGSDNHGLQYIQKEPRYQKVAGNELKVFVDFLCPGFKYKFRVRSSNIAGWGTWSEAVSGACKNFPLHIGYTKRIHRICIPFSAHYRITAQGAKAADGEFGNLKGGRGAIISATFSLKAGDILIVLCGGKSATNCSSGGGGGTFVALNEITLDNLLIAAGGGGGTRGLDGEDGNGMDASLDENGSDGRGFEHGAGGLNGEPGKDANSPEFRGPCWGFGGAGFLKNSTTASSFLKEGHGGQCGGFGGGGGIGSFGGGGGGGFSGGGGGRGGGGGGSYVHPTLATKVNRSLGNEGAGSIVIDKADVPYPDNSKPPVARGDSCTNSSGFGTLETPTLQSFSSQSSSSNGRTRYESQTSSTVAQPSSHPNSGEVTLDSSTNAVNPSSQHSSPGSTSTITTVESNSSGTLLTRDESTAILQPIHEVMVMMPQAKQGSQPEQPHLTSSVPIPHQEKNNAQNPKPVQEVAVVHMSTNVQGVLPPQPHFDQQANVQQLVSSYPYEQPRVAPHPSQLPAHYNSEPKASQPGIDQEHYRPDVTQGYPFHPSLSEPTLVANQLPLSIQQIQPPEVFPSGNPGVLPASTVFATQTVPSAQLQQPQFQHDMAHNRPVYSQFDPRQNQLPSSHLPSAVKDPHTPAASQNAVQNIPHQ